LGKEEIPAELTRVPEIHEKEIDWEVFAIEASGNLRRRDGFGSSRDRGCGGLIMRG
jgi:hypothetical protein